MLDTLRYGWRAGLAAALVVMAAVSGYLLLAPPTYTATAVIALLPEPQTTPSGELVRISVPSYARLATSDAVAATVAGRFEVPRGRVSSATVADVPPGTNTVLVSVRWDDPDLAADVANGVADELLTFSEGDPLLSAMLVASALPPTGPGFPSTELGFTLGALLALGAGGAAAVLASRRTRAVRYSTPVEGQADGAPSAAPRSSGPGRLPHQGMTQPPDGRHTVQPDLGG